MTLHLNQIKIPGHDLKVTISLPLAGEDMSGQGSYTPQAETGNKAKEINVSLYIKHNEADKLQLLTRLAEAVNGAGERMIYNVQHAGANAMNIRQACFQGQFSVRDDYGGHKQWSISFSLIEYRSVSEKRESRGGAPMASTVSPGSSELEAIINKARELLK